VAQDVTITPALGHALLVTQGGIGATPGYDAIDWRRVASASASTRAGVFDDTHWQVTQLPTPAMQVRVVANVGIARVDGTSAPLQGPYTIAPHNGVAALDVSVSDNANPRVDRVILHVRDSDYDQTGFRDVRLRVLTGTPTAGATAEGGQGAAAAPANSLELARIRVRAGSTTMLNSDITDFRRFATTQIRKLVGGVTSFDVFALDGHFDWGYDVSLIGTVNANGAVRRISALPNNDRVSWSDNVMMADEMVTQSGGTSVLTHNDFLQRGAGFGFSLGMTEASTTRIAVNATVLLNPGIRVLTGHSVANADIPTLAIHRYRFSGDYEDRTTRVTALTFDFGGGLFDGYANLRRLGG
jgi:hypothetical protein